MNNYSAVRLNTQVCRWQTGNEPISYEGHSPLPLNFCDGGVFSCGWTLITVFVSAESCGWLLWCCWLCALSCCVAKDVQRTTVQEVTGFFNLYKLTHPVADSTSYPLFFSLQDFLMCDRWLSLEVCWCFSSRLTLWRATAQKEAELDRRGQQHWFSLVVNLVKVRLLECPLQV